MRTAYGVETVRTAERQEMARLPEGALMQRAAAGLAAACAEVLGRVAGRVYGGRVVLLVGSGDNGGDALYAGARLARRGAGVTAVLLAPERAHGPGLAALRRAGGRTVAGGPEAGTGTAVELIARADLVVDGIVGIGGRGGLREEAVPLADAAARSRAAVVAVDLPSGVDADTGEVRGAAVRADLTVTFGAHKPGLLVDPAREYAGSVRLVDIGLPLPGEAAELEALQHADVARLLPVPGAESDKYRRGVVGVAAGSARYPGAAVLAVAGALRGGAGAVRYVGPAGDAVIARFPETLVSERGPRRAGRVQAWVVGPGAGDDAGTVAEVLAAEVPVLIDADGLRLADRDAVRARTAATLMTPHAGEAAALLGVAREEVEGARLASARELAARYGATVLLKGSTTVVAGADGGPVRVNPTGTSWLATAGSGDVLSGLAGSLLASGLSALDAGSAAAYLHGLAGRFAADGAPAGAHDVAEAIPRAWRDVGRG
ncbi:bifunctional ADP-dependent NAD(P)H-hydrate dehydratase/NAD(P)H-hydrate epimerase [Streptomyces parvulus]|uniref:Bifunctional NAD(P)H-hydrate repair enzyme n=2 Tax=Streptomyces parvulus TaxID=146923 RepID=A0A191V200_9ACTN|nr:MULTISPECIES: bifunctional ADP-dependent NAD(P)H-hydrate dehydratase/NAD(P)H-hydrate epimerase [Streptomyces]ANJ09041.1 bifunctional ADP-dependent (S)-NAD(P)H-hydrate dehydratase/NAD(P)H-hydrate epimerase [Streptomyces parvulus]MCC9158873.1 bifunctional ADP-dependent NAD(P)H-hydrate dehydratase/NAD(P)H-hydrate epimerase [Streptomyces parvulus]MCE7691880.1 bifunctional ADP-dependent NAD(P)H-hydrate dehydratase/NAD(P)H-hydrate epimerase [Streptomyces parvulus]MZD52419.1 bifunctional ADP-depend